MGGDPDVDESKRATLRRFATLGAASPLVGISGDDSTDARDAITGYLSRTPGAHFSKVRDDLQLGTGEAQHHLRRLESRDALTAVEDGDYKRFYPAGRFDEFERSALAALRRETQRGMILSLLADPSLGATAIATDLEVSPATVSTHAGDLERRGLLRRDDGYALRRPTTILTLVVRYAESFGDDALALAADADDLVAYDP